MPTPQYGDYQMEIYAGGLQGKLPRFPLDYASLERAAAEVLPSWVYSYVGYGAGDGNTQRANIEAFARYGKGGAVAVSFLHFSLVNHRQLVALSGRQFGSFHQHMLDMLIALFGERSSHHLVG